jgi:acetylornithine/succinyldiaminopimelate/putrescine aminotransferase
MDFPIGKAYGHTYETLDGSRWTDLISGIQNVPLGHRHPAVVNAITSVAWAGVINSYSFPTTSRQKLEALLPRNFPGFSWEICSTGTESIERILQLIKLRRGLAWVGKILYLPNAFHGKSFAVAKARYGPHWGCDLFEELSLPYHPPDKGFDAIIYEPVQGLTGDLPDEEELRALCDKVGAFLIADEMITGFGRCGKWFMSDSADFIACGKGISSGLPITFVASREKIGDIPTGWTTTAAGNAMCCEVAAATLYEVKISGFEPERFEEETKNIFPNVKGRGGLLHIPVMDGKIAAARMKAL